MVHFKLRTPSVDFFADLVKVSSMLYALNKFIKFKLNFQRKHLVLDDHNEDESNYQSLSGDDVLEEIFDSPRAELRDEVNVAYQDQRDPVLLGCFRDMTAAGRVGLDFFIQLDIDKQAVETK